MGTIKAWLEELYIGSSTDDYKSNPAVIVSKNADGKATTKLVLDESNMAVNNANITVSSPAAGLTNSNQAKYTFLPSTSTASANAVKTEFSIEQSGTNVTLDADGIVVSGLTGMSTLKVTFTDNSKDRLNHCVGTVFFNIPHL